MDKKCVVIFLTDDTASTYNGKPLMLQDALFCPVLNWCMRAWMEKGVGRFFVVCGEEDMAAAVNRVAANRGGIVVMEGGRCLGEVVLAIGGLMSDGALEDVNRDLESAKDAAFRLGVSREIDPFMTLSFMSLPVIPTLRLTTRGVIDVLKQQYI